MYLDARFRSDPDVAITSPPVPTSAPSVAEDRPIYPVAEPAVPTRSVAVTANDASGDLASRCREGLVLRLATALVEGASIASDDRTAKAAALREAGYRAAGVAPVPDDPVALVARLHRVARAGDRALAEQLRLLPAFEASGLWREAGCRDCAAWLDRELGIARVSALERLRVAHAFADLPVLESLFAAGRLGWSQVRALTRVADAACEAELAAAALELSASETFELCRRWRFGRERDASGEGTADAAEAAAAMRAFEARSLRWREVAPGRVRVVLELPTDAAAEYLRALEQSEDELREDDRARDRVDDRDAPDATPAADLATPARRSAAQYRADAAVLMSAKALAHAGEAVAKADRYRVLLTVDARVLADDPDAVPLGPGELPPERPAVAGFGPIAVATARRIAQGAALTPVAMSADGAVAGVGASTRAWPVRLERAIRARDRCCRMPGCTATRWTEVHHVVPVAEGGATTVANGALVCGACHRRLHEGGLRLEPVSADAIELCAGSALGLDDAADARARGYATRVRRFRLVRADGIVVAGPDRCGGPAGRRPVSTWKRGERNDDARGRARDGASPCAAKVPADAVARYGTLERYRIDVRPPCLGP